jgi:hypothetical protein
MDAFMHICLCIKPMLILRCNSEPSRDSRLHGRNALYLPYFGSLKSYLSLILLKDSDTNANTTASSVAGDTADGRRRRSEANHLRKSILGKKHGRLDTTKVWVREGDDYPLSFANAKTLGGRLNSPIPIPPRPH